MSGGPYLPLLSLNRSQSVRVGRGPGSAVPNSFPAVYNTVTNPQTGQLPHVFYADLSQSEVRRDIQRHSAIGAVQDVGNLVLNQWSDLFVSPAGGLAVSGGSGLTLNIAAGVIQSRTFGTTLSVSSVTGLAPAAVSSTDRFDIVVVDGAGVVSVIQGSPAAAAATYDVSTVATTGVPTGGTIKLSFTYNGYQYTTATIAFNASAATVASAILAATGGPTLPTGTLAGSGGPLTTGTVTLTASGALEGPISNLRMSNNSLTGGTNPNVTIGHTTTGVGAAWPNFPGGALPLAVVFIPSTATTSGNYTITGVALTS